MDLSEGLADLESKILKFAEDEDEHREFHGADKRKRAAIRLVPELASMLPPPWDGAVRMLRGPALQVLAEIVIHFVRRANKAETEAKEAKKEAKKAAATAKKAETEPEPEEPKKPAKKGASK